MWILLNVINYIGVWKDIKTSRDREVYIFANNKYVKGYNNVSTDL